MLANSIMWVLNSLCTLVSERIYKRIASRELFLSGQTGATDATEVSLAAWLFDGRKRYVPRWWVIILLLFNASLLPLEMRFEAGIEEKVRCQPRTVVHPASVPSPGAAIQM